LNGVDPKTKAALALMALPPLLMELLTGNLPLRAFANPLILLILFFGYSVPVLAIREVSVRWRLGAGGLLLLGAAYGIYNEGLGAKTALSGGTVPVPSFGAYGGTLGLNLPWMAYFMPVHALVSVFFPILFVHHMYPGVKDMQWVGGNATSALLAVSAAFGAAIFFSPYPFPVDEPASVFCLLSACMLCLVMAARLTRKSAGLPSAKSGMAPLLLGFGSAAYLIGLDLLANMRADAGLFLFAWALMLRLYSSVLRWKGWLTSPALVLAGIGFLMVLGVTGTINTVVLKGYPDGLLTGPAFEAAFVWAALKIRKAQMA
jgi:hypothetical protein